MKPKSTLRLFLAASAVMAVSSASALTYYWDSNDATSGFGSSGGTWSDPTAGTATSGWSTSVLGDTVVAGNSVSTATTDSINFGTNSAGLAGGTIAVSGTVNSGNITVGTQSGTIVLSGGTINFPNTVTMSIPGSTPILEIGSLITGAATSITKTGSNTTLRFLNTSNSYTGLTNITGALVVASLADGGVNSSIGASSNAASNLVINGSLNYVGTTNASTDRLFTGSGAINNNGSGTLTFTSTGTVAGLTLGGTYTGGANAFNPRITSGGFTKSGAGTWVLANNSNSYTGVTDIQNGTLSIGSIANYGTNCAIGQGTAGAAIRFSGTSTNAGTLVYTGGAQDTDRFIRAGVTSTNSTNGATILHNGTGALNFTGTIFNENFNSNGTNVRTITLGGTHGGAISGTIQNGSNAIALTKIGSGTWTLSGANTYTAATAIQEGYLVAGSNAPSLTNGAFGNAASDINLGMAGGNSDGGLLIGGAFNVGRNIRLLTSNGSDLGARVLTIGGITAANSEFSGNIFLGTTNFAGRGITLTAASNGQVTFSGVIQNPSGMDATTYTVTKAGAGTVVLSNSNTYTGGTTITAGTLTITGATQATNSISFTGGSLGLNTGGTVTATSAAVDLTNGTISVTGSTGAASYTLLTAASITGTPVLAAPVPGYALQVVDGVADELRLVKPVGGSGFAAWATTGTLGPVTFEGDTNGDGVQDGMAFLLGAMNPDDNASGRLPKVSESGGDLVLTFNCLPIAARGTATLKVAHSTDLGTWTTTADVVPDADDAVPDNHVTFVVDTVSQAPLNKVTATINSVAAGGGGKLFGRVKGVTP
jgi:fibronectin-binding autotransporter adhesin